MEENKENLKQNKMDWRPIIFFYVKTTSWIIFPLVVGAFIGKKVAPAYLFLFIIVSFFVTCFGIYKEIKNYKKDLENKK